MAHSPGKNYKTQSRVYLGAAAAASAFSIRLLYVKKVDLLDNLLRPFDSAAWNSEASSEIDLLMLYFVA